MQFKKYIHLFLSLMLLGSAGLFTTGCGKKSDTDKAAETVEDAAQDAADAVKGMAK